MIPKGQKVNIFVPAQALQHDHNAENDSRDIRIRAAIRRYVENDDFFSQNTIEKYRFVVLIDDIKFNALAFGYEVLATLRPV